MYFVTFLIPKPTLRCVLIEYPESALFENRDETLYSLIVLKISWLRIRNSGKWIKKPINLSFSERYPKKDLNTR